VRLGVRETSALTSLTRSSPSKRYSFVRRSSARGKPEGNRDQAYSVTLIGNLTAGETYLQYSYVSSWIYTEATGDAFASAIMIVGEGGDYAQHSWVSLLHDG
jgi:hypothetical protein